jgi:hypothetical protein
MPRMRACTLSGDNYRRRTHLVRLKTDRGGKPPKLGMFSGETVDDTRAGRRARRHARGVGGGVDGTRVPGRGMVCSSKAGGWGRGLELLQGGSRTDQLGPPAEGQDLRRRLYPSQGADTGLATGMSPGHKGLASFNNLISSRICPANERETSRKGPERERPGGPDSEQTPTEEDRETLCKLELERLPYDLGVIDAGNDPDALRMNGTPMVLRA